MVNAALLAALTAYSVAVAAAPTTPQVKGFSVSQVAVPKSAYRHPAAQLAKAYGKYHATVPTQVAAAAASTGSVTTNPTSDDEEYITQVTVGEDTLSLDFDTGSADLWVFSSQTPASERSGHDYYTPGSSAKKLSGATWDISYGDGSSASGDVYLDKVTVGGVSYASQAVESAEKVSSEFTEDTASDGLLGLAFSSINTVQPTPQNTFFDNVKSSLSQPLFAAALKHNAPGVYDFGFTDSSKYTGSITYTDVDNSQGFWGFTVDSYSIGSDSTSDSISGIADTGTTLLLLDDSIVEAYYEQVDGATYDDSQGGYVFPSSTTPPDFSVTIGDYTATVPGEYISFESVGNGQTYGGIQSNSGIGFSIFGDVFLKSQYVVFDASGPQLGFAPQA
ncbi:hypothetical protein DTO027B5_4865 [Paecilomyces variotii]|nr:hypothetical protein DTO027B3_6600 [Paecilomyces variotii]KAJ9333305.1 hypothetical protein DTO027B5_4865 [Paecilomyces variotii]